jgi:hypothetical protein
MQRTSNIMNAIRSFHSLVACALLASALVATAVSSAATAVPDVINLEGAQAKKALDELRARLQAAPTDAQALKATGILLHQMSRRTPNKEQVEEGEKLLKQATQAEPKDAEALAWLGSIVTMKALFETDPGKQTFFVKLGTRSMDSAVTQAPDNLVVRLVRANNSMELPPFLKRTRFAVEDFDRYLALCQSAQCPAAEVNSARTALALAKKRVADMP